MTTLSLFFYFGTVMTVRIPWEELARGFFIPKLTWSNDFLTIVTAVLGTTISPYLFFWQSSQEAEDERVKPYRHPLVKAPSKSDHAFKRIGLDTYVGMAFANLVALAIIVTTAATLMPKELPHRNVPAGCGSLATGRGKLCFCGLLPWNNGHRPSCGAGFGRLDGLCNWKVKKMESWSW